MPISTYAAPVSHLLALGQASLPLEREKWVDYSTAHSVTIAHLPELTRLASDVALWKTAAEPERWAVVHAWRALSQVAQGTGEAPLEALLTFLQAQSDDDWVLGELPETLAALGPAALPGLARFLHRTDVPLNARGAALEAIEKLVAAHPAQRTAAEAMLLEVLALYKENPTSLNGFVIGALLDWQAQQALPLIEEAFAAMRVDESFITLQEARYALGAPGAQPLSQDLGIGRLQQVVATLQEAEAKERAEKRAQEAEKKARAKRKAVKAARRTSRHK